LSFPCTWMVRKWWFSQCSSPFPHNVGRTHQTITKFNGISKTFKVPQKSNFYTLDLRCRHRMSKTMLFTVWACSFLPLWVRIARKSNPTAATNCNESAIKFSWNILEISKNKLNNSRSGVIQTIPYNNAPLLLLGSLLSDEKWWLLWISSVKCLSNLRNVVV
jgi:hypothetical protein